MNGLERVTRALQIQEPDRVPFFEPPSWKIMGEVLPGGSYVDAIEHFDLDAVMIDDRANERYLCEQIDDVLFRNQWGTVVQMAAEALPHPVDGPISSGNDLDEWTPPDPDAPWRFEVLEAVVKRYKGEKAIIASFADPFNVANEMRGASDHYMDFVRNPRLVDRLAAVITDYYLRYLRNCIEAGADIIFITGDYATTKWPMLSPGHFAKHVIPYLKTLVDASIEGGALTMKHTDGNIMPILDQIVDTGIHGLHPIDPNAGMDLGQMKKDYGDRLCLIGNVDCAHVLTWGSVEEVRQDVKRCIRQAARGGGFICMSSNSIHSGVTAERYVAMVDAIREYGQYPIAV
jgi:uroporphyrinogen decarboxylase